MSDGDEGKLTVSFPAWKTMPGGCGNLCPVVLCQHSLGTGKTHTGCCEPVGLPVRSSLGDKQGKRHIPGVWLKEFCSTHRSNFLVTVVGGGVGRWGGRGSNKLFVLSFPAKRHLQHRSDLYHFGF